MDHSERKFIESIKQDIEDQKRPLIKALAAFIKSIKREESISNTLVHWVPGVLKDEAALNCFQELKGLLELFERQAEGKPELDLSNLADEIQWLLKEKLKLMVCYGVPQSTNPLRPVEYSAKKDALLDFVRFLEGLLIKMQNEKGIELTEGFEYFEKII